MSPEERLKHFQDNFKEKHDPFVTGIRYLADTISYRRLWTHNVSEPLVPTARQHKKSLDISKTYRAGREMGAFFSFGDMFDPKQHELVRLENAIHILDRLGKLDDESSIGRMIESVRASIPGLNQDPNHIPRSFNRSPTQNFIYLLNANKGYMGQFLQSYANEMFDGIFRVSLMLISHYNLPQIAKQYVELALTINYDHSSKNELRRIKQKLDKHFANSGFEIGESLKYAELYVFDDYLEHLKSLKLGEFTIGIIESWHPLVLRDELQEIFNILPNSFDRTTSEKFLDRINGVVSDPSFWLLKCDEFLNLVKDLYIETLSSESDSPTNSDIIGIAKASLLNLCYSCLESKNKKFVKKIVFPTFLQKTLSKQAEQKGINYFRDRLLQSGLFPKVGAIITLLNYGQGRIYAVNEISGDVTIEFMDHKNEQHLEQFSFAELSQLRNNV